LLLDQRRLPAEQAYLTLRTAQETAEAIRAMVVRGAPAIGIAAAFGLVLEAHALRDQPEKWRDGLARATDVLAASRPTAVNLAWALDQMRTCWQRGVLGDWQSLLGRANQMLDDDVAGNQRMGALGAAMIAPGSRVLTHCNTGSLATGGYGTALGVIRSAWREGRLQKVFATETRPWLQGARLTAWELIQDQIPVNLLVDSAAAYLMARGEIDWLIVGADRIAANGDVANKIGTYALAVLALRHGVNMMVVAPTSTIDMTLAIGADIPIEERGGEELLVASNLQVSPYLTVINPAFDVTVAELVDALVTERGVVERPNAAAMQQLMAGSA